MSASRGGVEYGDSDGAVVRHVQLAARPGEFVVAADQDVGLELSDSAGDVAAEGEAVLDDAVGVIEELH